MARKNRMVIRDGCYHVVTRVANRAFLLKDAKLKDEIVDIMYGTADFSGVELYSWCVMDNHLHMFVHVPEVPEKYRLAEDTPPDAYAFGMRPAECRAPLWPANPPEGDRPGQLRPELDFMLTDGQMLDRLLGLYGRKRVGRIAEEWASHRLNMRDDVVDGAKARYCRRMYNLSQFVKTVKERVSSAVNRGGRHAGTVWEGRFRSVLVEKTAATVAVVNAYIGYNPVKAGIAPDASSWRWSSYALACGDSPRGARCREMYERAMCCTWPEAKEKLDAMYAERAPAGADPEHPDAPDGDLRPKRPRLTVGHMIHMRVRAFERGGYISTRPGFAMEVMAMLPRRYPATGDSSIWYLSRFDWSGLDAA